MNKLWVLCCLLGGLACHPPGVEEAGQPLRPNILLIMADDLGQEWISCYGADSIETPRIDQLAREGLRFTHAWSMPQCTPTRVTLLTGQYPFRHGWVNHWDVPRWGAGCHFDPEENMTFARVLKSAAYHTAIAGKWQINDFRVQPDILQAHGFDDWCVWTGFETGNPPSAERYWDPYLHTREGSRTYAGEFGDEVFADFLIKFAAQHPDSPWMMYFPMCLPHGPLTSTPLEPELPTYQAMIRYVDHLTGKMVDALDSLGMLDNTLIIWTADNGSSRGITGYQQGNAVEGAKARLGKGGTAMPFIARGPGIPAGKVSKALVDFSDLFPTLAAWAGAELPRDFPLDGKSFLPVLKGAEHSDRDWVLSMGCCPAALQSGRVVPRDPFIRRAIGNEQYKLIVNEVRQPEALFDLAADPFQRVNLLTRSAIIPDGARKLVEAIATFPARDAAPRYQPLPPQSWDRKE